MRSELLTIPQAARLLGVSRRAVYNWIEVGRLGVEGKPWRVRRGELRRFSRERMARKPGVLYARVMSERGCSYDAARMWVRRAR